MEENEKYIPLSMAAPVLSKYLRLHSPENLIKDFKNSPSFLIDLFLRLFHKTNTNTELDPGTKIKQNYWKGTFCKHYSRPYVKISGKKEKIIEYRYNPLLI